MKPAIGYALNGNTSNSHNPTVDALAFAVNTTNCLAKANAPSENPGGAVSSFAKLNVSYQLAGGGANINPGSNAINLFSWAIDTATALVKGFVTVARGYGVAASHDSAVAYCMGGYVSGYSVVVDAISVAVDTANAVTKGSLTQGRHQLSGGMGSWS